MKEDPEEICKLLAEQYQSVFSEPEETKKIIDPGTFFNSPQISEDPTTLKNIEFSEQDIIAAIEELKPNSAPGPDGIPTNVLIKCKDALARPFPSNINEVEPQFNQRTGRKCVRKIPPSQAPARIKTLLSSSLPYNGPRIFNCLPRRIRDLTGCSVDSFKTQLDSVLRTVPDEPPVPGYISLCRAVTNSLPDQVDLQRRDTGLGRSVGTPLL
ncbi:hypothetical protein Pcinc_030182 [Petrolisthes cinctipes]|uniref:Uncharacterized protein n=1 Tax=Petrolisthes cinctipes TaxID=88211 RepID=A0AAE1K4U6_PETCI|nr:hypothetical protein Pcinc_030182 [Petrolisthes cinctipes]